MSTLSLLVSLTLLILFAHTASAQTVSPPSGWEKYGSTDQRVFTKGMSRIEIGPWQSLDGKNLKAFVLQFEKKAPEGMTYVSTLQQKDAGNIFLVGRKIRIKNDDGASMLVGCAGKPGFARIMMVASTAQQINDFKQGGEYLESVCKNEPAGQSTNTPSVTSGTAPVIGRNLEAENTRIPAENRPIAAVAITKITTVGFPPITTGVGHMMMTFKNGYSTYCTNWDLLNQSPTPESIGDKCTLTQEHQDDTKLEPFSAGDRVELALRNVSGAGFSLGSSNTSTMQDDNLKMTKDGKITFSTKGYLATNAGSNRSAKQVTGRYYLSDYTLTVETEEGELFHTFIGVLNKKNGTVTSLFLSDKFYSE